MSEQLQHLIDRIRSEGLEKAEAEAARIRDAAKADADAIVQQASRQAEALVKKAETDAQTYAERGRQSLDQAARDLILTVQQAVEAAFDRLLQGKVAAALTPDTLHALIRDAIRAYAAQGANVGEMTLRLAPDAEKTFRESAIGAFQEAISQGLRIQSDNGVIAGFKVTFSRDHVEHDFTAAAIAESLSRLVRPHLAERLRAASQAVHAPAP